MTGMIERFDGRAEVIEEVREARRLESGHNEEDAAAGNESIRPTPIGGINEFQPSRRQMAVMLGTNGEA